MKYSIEKETTVYKGFLKVLKATTSYQSFHSNQEIVATRECLERGDSVACLIYEEDSDSFLFTKQFRYPSARRDEPWMLELVAGSLDENEKPYEAIKREIQEELGYKVETVKNISNYFPSPGGCSEIIHLFYATVTTADKLYKAGGKTDEKEDIELLKISRSDAKKMLLKGAFNNSITIIGLQWYFLNQL